MNILPYSQLLDDKDRKFDILLCDQLNVVTRDIKTKELQTFTRNEFAFALKTYLIPVTPNSPHSALDPFQKLIKEKQAPYLSLMKKIFEEENAHMTTLSIYKRVIAEVEEQQTINSKPGTVVKVKHPSQSSLSRWWKRFKDAGFSHIDSLPKRKSKRNTTDSRSEQIMWEGYEKFMMGKITPSIAVGHAKYENWVNEMNDPTITIVSREKFRKHHHSFNDLDRAEASGNRAEVNKLMRTYKTRIKTDRVLTRIEADRLALNLRLIDDTTGEVTGKVALYIAIDCHSRYPIAVTVEFGEAEKAIGGVNLLRNIVIPASEQLDAFGIPIRIICDNGPGFNNETFAKTAESLKCELIYAPSNQPYKKPFVESFNKTIRSEFLESAELKVGNKIVHGVPGYKGKRYEGKNTNRNPTDETLKQAAAMTVDSFVQNLHDFLVHYVNQPHNELNGKTPQEVWSASCLEYPLIPCNYEHLKTSFHVFQGETTLNETGKFRFNKQDFFGEEVQNLFWQLKTGKDSGKNPKVSVLHDTQDCRSVTLAVTLSGDTHVTKIIAHNIDLVDEQIAISFEVANMNHSTPIRRSIYCGEAELIKRKRRKIRNGKQTQNMEQNFTGKCSTKDIISQSNSSIHERQSKRTDPLLGTELSQENQDDSHFRNKEGYEKW